MNRFSRYLPLLLISTIFFTIAIDVNRFSSAITLEVPVPDSAEACVDRGDIFTAGGAELIADETVDGVDYYLIFTYRDTPQAEQYPNALFVSVSNGKCEIEIWNTPGDHIIYADFVPLQAAEKFREIEYGMVLERMGRQDFINAFDLSEITLYPEEETALERLGVLDEIRNNQ